MQAYRDKTGFEVRATGLYTCDELRYGASPDGVVVDRATGEEGLLEVKCLYRERRRSSCRLGGEAAGALPGPGAGGQLALSEARVVRPRDLDSRTHLAIFRVRARRVLLGRRPEAGARRVLGRARRRVVPSHPAATPICLRSHARCSPASDAAVASALAGGDVGRRTSQSAPSFASWSTPFLDFPPPRQLDVPQQLLPI